MRYSSKLINLLKKTGDKAIILDENGHPSYVVMTISNYEQLILGKSGVEGLTEEELLAKINREIELWKDSHEMQEIPIDQYDFSQDLGEFQDIRQNQEYNKDNWEKEDKLYFEPVE